MVGVVAGFIGFVVFLIYTLDNPVRARSEALHAAVHVLHRSVEGRAAATMRRRTCARPPMLANTVERNKTDPQSQPEDYYVEINHNRRLQR